MRVEIERNTTKPSISYPCILAETYGYNEVIVLATSHRDSIVLHSDNHDWAIGYNFGAHSDSPRVFDGTISLSNTFLSK